ncbi:unnamed protein product, partial [Amoebophrya sp. A25]
TFPYGRVEGSDRVSLFKNFDFASGLPILPLDEEGKRPIVPVDPSTGAPLLRCYPQNGWPLLLPCPELNALILPVSVAGFPLFELDE